MYYNAITINYYNGSAFKVNYNHYLTFCYLKGLFYLGFCLNIQNLDLKKISAILKSPIELVIKVWKI